MQIKFPTYSPLRFFCGLARPCNISGIRGEGLSNEDRVMLLTNCGGGILEETAKDGPFLGGCGEALLSISRHHRSTGNSFSDHLYTDHFKHGPGLLR